MKAIKRITVLVLFVLSAMFAFGFVAQTNTETGTKTVSNQVSEKPGHVETISL